MITDHGPKPMIKEGLQPRSRDRRDFKLGAAFGTVKLADLPRTPFEKLAPRPIKNQFDTDMCGAFASSSAAEYHEGTELDPCYSFAKIKQLLGTIDGFGADLRTIMRAGIKTGFLPRVSAPFSLDKFGRDFVANWHNYSATYDEIAAAHKQQAFFDVEGPYDTFDNIRAALYQHQVVLGDKTVVVAGTGWRSSWTYAKGGIIPDTTDLNEPATGHAIVLIDQKEINGKLYLVVQNSMGDGYGDNGFFYMPREVANRDVKIYGAMMFKDFDPESDMKVYYTIIDLCKNVIEKLKYLLVLRQEQTMNVTPKEPETAPVPPQPPATPESPESQYEWDPPERARHSVRVICDEEGLTLKQKNLLCAVIRAESGFDPKKISEPNKNGTRDYGICQFNDGKNKNGVPYWIGEGADFASTEEVLDAPEKCVRVMIREFKKGNLKYWTAFANGAYRKYL